MVVKSLHINAEGGEKGEGERASAGKGIVYQLPEQASHPCSTFC